MDSPTDYTYKALVKPIPPSNNLANVTAQDPVKTCQACAAIIPDRRKTKKGLIRIDYEFVDQYPNFPELKSSARTGCGLCKFLRKTIRAKWATRPMEEWGVGPLREKEGLWDELFATPWDRKVKIRKLVFSLGNTNNNFSNMMDITSGESGQNGVVVGFNLEFGPATVPSPSDEMTPYGDISQILGFRVFDSQDLDLLDETSRRRLPSSSTLSKENLTLVSSWVNDCKKFHLNCQMDKESWLPSRLLDVGPPDGSEDTRLIESAGVTVYEPYVALSHMWGGPKSLPPLRAVINNQESLKSGIPMWQLPQNFAHAVIVTRQLGLRYIWIDSLCILQDSTQDWEKEASMMHKIYRYAEVTIVATSATSSHDGFLQRDLSMVPAVRVEYPKENEPSTPGSFILSPFDEAEPGTWYGDVESALWNRRAWTCQERKLSTRMLHFCKNKLYFECRACIKSEENEPYTASRLFQLWPRNDDWMQTSTYATSENADSLLKAKMYKIWTKGVTEYTQRLLTRDSDKLPAIQSIAAEMSTTISDIYIPSAGIWKGNLKHDLLWQVNDGLASMPSKYRAPTWSWASLEARILWTDIKISAKPSHTSLSKVPFEVLEIADVGFENTQRAFLKVKTCLKPIAFIIECGYDDRWVFASRGIFPYDIFTTASSSDHPSTCEIPDSKKPLSMRELAIERGEVAKFAEGRLDLDDKDGLTNSRRALSYMHVDSTCRPSGLILESMENTEGIWKRVGVASVFSKEGDMLLDNCFSENDQAVVVTII